MDGDNTIESFLPDFGDDMALDPTGYSTGENQYFYTFEVTNIANRTMYVCLLFSKSSKLTVRVKLTASICNPEDSYRPNLGEEIALGRALKADEWDLVITVNENQNLIKQVRAATEELLLGSLKGIESRLTGRDHLSEHTLKSLKKQEEHIGKEINQLCK